MQEKLVPPWLKYPEIPRYSIGWRMGYGEDYLIQWWKWWESVASDNRLEYFRKYTPIPFEWLDWVTGQFGFEDSAEMLTSEGEFKGIQWLHKQGFVNFTEWKKWYDEVWKTSE